MPTQAGMLKTLVAGWLLGKARARDPNAMDLLCIHFIMPSRFLVPNIIQRQIEKHQKELRPKIQAYKILITPNKILILYNATFIELYKYMKR